MAVQRSVERVQGFIKGVPRELEEAVKRLGKQELKIELLISSPAYIFIFASHQIIVKFQLL